MFPKIKYQFFIFFLLIFLIIPNLSLAAESTPDVNSEVVTTNQAKVNFPLNIYFFYSESCPHCHKEALFLAKLEQEYKDKINVLSFEVSGNRANFELFQQFNSAFKIGTNNPSVPTLFAGDQNIIGYFNDEYTGAQVQNLVDQCLALKCEDVGASIMFPEQNNNVEGTKTNSSESNSDEIFKVPVLGEIDLEKLSLFGATMVLGALDGFNPCAMWVLIFLISLLLSVESVKRRWILGLSFIGASALVYFLFMVAWLNIFLFIGYLLVVRIIIGGLAIAFGIYNLQKYYKNKAGTCEVTHTESRQKILQKIKNIALHQKLIPALFGIILLAFAVNIIELACSAGFPAIYTKMLAMHELSIWNYYLYILLYIFIFMLDDIIVFAIAMITLRLAGVDSKYSRYSNLIGGIVILILGILLILRPELLMFG